MMFENTKQNLRFAALAVMIGVGAVLAPSHAYAEGEPCDPAVEEAIKEAAEEGYKRAIEGIQEDVIKPAAVKVASCLDDILNAGFGLDFKFKPPSLSGILNSIAKRICSKANDMFNEATSKLTDALPLDAFEDFGIKINAKIRRGRDERFELRPRIYSPIDGSRQSIDNIERGTNSSNLADKVRGLFGD
ncbi:MAG: hypothetical protein Alpg2KO_21800 [Alphaproteobacteria bacterium]